MEKRNDRDNDPLMKQARVYGINDLWKLSLQTYEAKVVNFILNRFDLQGFAGKLRAQRKEEQGFGCLDLSYFHREFSSFPVILHCRKFAHRTKHLSTWFNQFEQSTELFWYEELKADYTEHIERGGRVALIFYYPYLRNTACSLVIRDGDFDNETPGRRFVSTCAEGTCVVEQLSDFLNSIARCWPDTAPLKTSTPTLKRKRKA